MLVTEIQQSSDTTFRLFDWNRVDGQGNGRPLHIEQSLEVADCVSGPVKPIKADPLEHGWQSLVNCDKFVFRVMQSGASDIGGDGKFHILTVPTGRATLQSESDSLTLTAGATVMLPASMGKCEVAIEPVGGSMSTVLAFHLP